MLKRIWCALFHRRKMLNQDSEGYTVWCEVCKQEYYIRDGGWDGY